MVDVTALAYQWWLRVQADPKLPEHLKVDTDLKRLVIEAFEQGYMAHSPH